MRIIAFMNQKGGVGKTTTAVNLGACLAELGRKVLLIDMDPQANSSIHLGIDIYKTGESIYSVLIGGCPLGEAVIPTGRKNFEIIPSNIDLSGAEVELASAVGRETILRDALMEHVQEGGLYEYVLIDCPPSLGLLSLNALTTASEVFIPVQTQFFALQGMGKLLEVINLVKRRLNPSLELTGVILTMYDKRTTLAHEVVEDVRKFFKEKVFASMIRRNVSIAEAPGHGKSIIEYKPKSAGARDYMSLAREAAGVEAETEPMVWPPPGFEEEARRAEAKLRALIEHERKQAHDVVEGLAEVGLETVDARELAADEMPTVLDEEPARQKLSEDEASKLTAEVDAEIREIKEMIALASGEGFMKSAQEPKHPAPQHSFPPAIPVQPPWLKDVDTPAEQAESDGQQGNSQEHAGQV